MKIVAIIQARMGSTRLPGKTLMPLAGKPMLVRVVERVSRAKQLDDLVVATTESPMDANITALCGANAWKCFRGSEEDVLDRYYRAAQATHADVIVRVTADCPVVDPDLIDSAITSFRLGRFDYVSNGLDPRTYPRGLDVEVFSNETLGRAWKEDANLAWREHVTPYIYRHPEEFRLHRIAGERDFSAHRWSVDTAEDYELLRKIYEHFDDRPFGWMAVLRLVEQHPDWAMLNSHIHQKVVP